MYSKIESTGIYLPERVRTNNDLERILGTDLENGGTTDKWITTRVGITERRVSVPLETHEFMACAAGRKAIATSPCKPQDIGVIVASTTAPPTIPANASELQYDLCLSSQHTPAFDVRTNNPTAFKTFLTAVNHLFNKEETYSIIQGNETVIFNNDVDYHVGNDAIKSLFDSEEFNRNAVTAVIKYHNEHSLASTIANKLGLDENRAFDVNSGCASFNYALALADQLTKHDEKPYLVISVDKMLDVTNPTDRSTVILFGEAAGAALLVPSEQPGFIYHNLHTDGAERNLITLKPHENGKQYFSQVGQEVYKWVFEQLEGLIDAGLSHTTEGHDIYVAGHQPNVRAITKTARKFRKQPHIQFPLVADKTGNCSSTTSALTLDKCFTLSQPGDYIIGPAFGAGLSWGTYVYQK